MIVMKFGGSSQRNPSAILRAGEAVIQRLQRRPVVVLSAIGKTTNRLLQVFESSTADHSRADEILGLLESDHLRISDALLGGDRAVRSQERIRALFGEIRDHLSDACKGRRPLMQAKDAVVSYGELLSTWIFSQALEERGVRARLLDSRKLLRTDSRFASARIDEAASVDAIRRCLPADLPQGGVAVLQGFIAADAEGCTTTIGRGGSDLSASLVGAALDVEEIQIWTDVPGILTADPRLARRPFKIKSLSFDEAAELAYFGAKVLHPSALAPAIHQGIPVSVLDSAHIDRPGTTITRRSEEPRVPVKSIACKKGITIINVNSPRMLLAYGFVKRIADVFDKHRIPIDVIATSEVNVSLTIDSSEHLEDAIRELSQIGNVNVETHMAIVSVVGDSLARTQGIPARVFSAVEKIDIRVISQGASRLNLTFLISEADLADAVRCLHGEFFQSPDPRIFEPCEVSQVALAAG